MLKTPLGPIGGSSVVTLPRFYRVLPLKMRAFSHHFSSFHRLSSHPPHEGDTAFFLILALRAQRRPSKRRQIHVRGAISSVIGGQGSDLIAA
jgi:hypothetical protein